MQDRTLPASDARFESSIETAYSITARRLHWWTVVLLVPQLVIGLYMAYRANTLHITDGLTNVLYNSHKLLGVVILLVVMSRLLYRFIHGAPADEPTLEGWQRSAAHTSHWLLYLLLLAVPIGGYIGISLYPALDIFGLFSLPALVAPNKEAASTIFYWHWVGALAIVGLVAVHIMAAMYHYLIRKDAVLQRMWPGAGRRS